MSIEKSVRVRRLGLILLGTLLLGLVLACSLFNQPPIARIFVDVSSGMSPLTVTFDGSSSSDSDGDVELYEWDFGDDDTDTNLGAQRTFITTDAVETFNVTLTVTDDDGATSQTTQSIEVLRSDVDDTGDGDGEPTVAGVPAARFTATKLIGPKPLVVTFDASGSSPGSGTIVAYNWAFGDGETGTGVSVEHTFEPETTVTVTYLVELTVRDSATEVDTQQMEVIVIVPSDETSEVELVADVVVAEREFVYESTSLPGTPSLIEVTFNPSGSYANAGRFIEYFAWNFGDGALQVETSDAQVAHTYELRSATKTHVVSLTVFDDQGLEDTFVFNLTLTQEIDD